MAFVLRFKLPAAACQALLALFNVILPGCIPATNYLVDTILTLICAQIRSCSCCPLQISYNQFLRKTHKPLSPFSLTKVPVVNCLMSLMENCIINSVGANVTLQFNCDGAPIFTSSRFSIWPL